MLQTGLPINKKRGQPQATEKRQQQQWVYPVAAMPIGQCPQQGCDAQRQRDQPHPVECNRVRLGFTPWQVAGCHDHAHDTGRQHHQEHGTPGQRIHQHPANGRSNGRAQNNTQPIDTHGLTATIEREHLEDGNHGQRLDQPGQQALPYPGSHQQGEMFTGSANNGHHHKQAHGQQISTTGPKSLGTPGIEQHAHCHCCQETGRQPVHLILRQLELDHDGGNSHIDNGGCQHHGHGAQHHRYRCKPAVARAMQSKKRLDLRLHCCHYREVSSLTRTSSLPRLRPCSSPWKASTVFSSPSTTSS